MKKKFFIPMLLITIILAVLFVPAAKSKTKAYYSGDAIIYNGQVIVGSTNMANGLELFKLTDNKLTKVANVRSFRAQYSGYDDYYDLAFSLEGAKLFVYLVDGRYLYKYDISNPAFPALTSQVTDNSWDYFLSVERKGDKILTYGSKGMKIWNLDGQVIDRYDLINKYPDNINFQEGSLIFNMESNNLRIFDAITRNYVRDISIFSAEEHERKSFVDKNSQSIYFVDDLALKKYNYEGILQKTFKFTSDRGYVVDGYVDQNYLYFTDGKGVVKFSKDKLEPISWAYTTDLGEKGGWAMGLKVLRDEKGDKLVIFNNSTILVLDKDLKMLGYAVATEEDLAPQESLFLGVDKNRAAGGSLVSLRGGGFAVGEDLVITFADETYLAKADNQGRFVTVIDVPDVLPIMTDIKVIGKYSNLSYSVGFEIE